MKVSANIAEPPGLPAVHWSHPDPASLTVMSFGERLKRLRQARGLTQDRLASLLPQASRSTVAQWETGRNLPAIEMVQEIDDLLGAQGQLFELSDQVRTARSKHNRQRSPTLPSDDRTDQEQLARILTDVGNAVAQRVLPHGESEAGWVQELHKREESEQPPAGESRHPEGRQPTPVSTAYGVLLMSTLRALGIRARWASGDSEVGWLKRASRFMLAAQNKDRGWSTGAVRNARRSTPEATATVLLALYRLDPLRNGEEDLATLKTVVGEQNSFDRTATVATVLETVAQIFPDDPWLDDLVEKLLGLRPEHEGWPEKYNSLLLKPLPSVAHTGRAVWALQLARPSIIDDARRDRVDAAVTEAANWLARQNEVQCAAERSDSEGTSLLHFTAPWVLKALVASDHYNRYGATCRAALQEILTAYRMSGDQHLWLWRNGEMPIWMSLDGVQALQALALTQQPREWLPLVGPAGTSTAGE